jgi:hypothetical protein
MQMISQQTSMRLFALALILITVSTILGMVILTGTLQTTKSRIGRKAENLICKHSCFVESKLQNLLPEQPTAVDMEEPKATKLDDLRIRILKTFDGIVRRIRVGEDVKGWEYVGFVATICFVAIPVHEVNSARRFYGLLANRNNNVKRGLGITPSEGILCANTPATTSQRDVDDTGRDLRCRATQVMEIKAKEAEAIRSRNLNKNRTAVLKAVFYAVRALLLIIWIPLILFEYTVLIFALPITRRRESVQPSDKSPSIGQQETSDSISQRETPDSISQREALAHFFAAPLVWLGLNTSQRQTQEHHHDIENSLTPPHPIDSELYKRSPSFGGRTMVEDIPRSNIEPPIPSAQHWRHIVSQSAFQLRQQQHNTN